MRKFIFRVSVVIFGLLYEAIKKCVCLPPYANRVLVKILSFLGRINIIFLLFLVPSVYKGSFTKILLLGKVEQVDLGKVERAFHSTLPI